MAEDTVTLTVRKGDEEMPEQIAEKGNMEVVLTGMGGEFGAATGRRVGRFDQIAADAASMWAIAMTSPTVMAAHGMKVASEAGSGRSRIEANSPASTQTTGG
jgi:adenylosuccinate synthase